MSHIPAIRARQPSDEAATVDLSGRCVGNSYVLICPVGHGATGTVWRGLEQTSGDQVAVKLLHEGLLRQPKLVTRFVQERSILKMLRHEHIVGVRDLFSVGESLALAMDFVGGGSLRERLRDAGTLEPAEAARLLAQVAAALNQAHSLGVVHRDVKPDNILLQVRAERADVRLTDFGIARVLDAPGVTTPHAVIGTPHYMAPEAISGGDATPAADVYALGIVLFELVAGRTPYTGEPFAVLRGHLDETPRRPEGMPDPVWRVIGRCLGKDPASRPSAAELELTLRQLRDELAGVPALAAPPVAPGPAVSAVSPPPGVRVRPKRRPPNRPRSWAWGRRGALALLIAGALAGSALSGYSVWQVRQNRAAGNQALLPGADPAVVPDRSALPAATTATGAAPALKAVQVAGTAPDLPGLAAHHTRKDDAGPQVAASAGAGVDTGAGKVGGQADVAFGPYRCGDEYEWDVGHPVLAQPCHALGSEVRVMGRMEATPGVQADVSLTVRDARTDDVVAGPYTCEGLMFTDFKLEQTCGPADLAAPHGHRYVVVESWRYTGRSLLPGGTVRGVEFDW
ncbi:serine/threonine-protein kinase [Actinoplanes sp. NPDC049681]|uniref:serine/threonine-protein kinase n=1 Tax=Actinoplanes sp. NPDC049681 TaxID=3363905 RepID=UPI0037AD9933